MAKVKANLVVVVALLAAGSFAGGAMAQQGDGQKLTDEQIRQRMIEQSIAQYSGRCACPYNRMSNGNKCGKRSAYSRPGGSAPLCYAADISDEMVRQFRSR